MEVRCAYETVFGNYRCSVKNRDIPENVELKFVGNHKGGRTDNDVKHINFYNCKITKVPQGLTKKFPNLEVLKIGGCGLKTISKNDLIEYKNFKEFNFHNNNIEYLPGDLFEDFGKLEIIILQANNLKIVEPNILDGLDNLKKISLFGFLEHGEVTVHSRVLSLKQIKTDLLNKFFQNDAQLLKDFVKKLQIQVQKAKKFNKNLTIKSLEEKCNNLEQENKHLVEANQALQNLLLQKETLNQEIQSLRNSEEALNQEIRILEASQTQFDQEFSQNQKTCLDLVQGFSKLEQEFGRKILGGHQNNHKFWIDIKNFIQDENTKDFQIQIDEHEFPVHKFLLAARSPTLAEILKNNPEVENLKLVDISVEIFEIILKFLYTDELPGDDGTNFLQLFAAAGKLRIQELQNYAAEQLINTVDTENALEILKITFKYEQKELKQKAFVALKRRYPERKIKDEWIDDAEKIEKLISFLKKMEEMEKSFEEMM